MYATLRWFYHSQCWQLGRTIEFELSSWQVIFERWIHSNHQYQNSPLLIKQKYWQWILSVAQCMQMELSLAQRFGLVWYVVQAKCLINNQAGLQLTIQAITVTLTVNPPECIIITIIHVSEKCLSGIGCGHPRAIVIVIHSRYISIFSSVYSSLSLKTQNWASLYYCLALQTFQRVGN